MTTQNKNTEWITNEVQVDRYARIRLAGINYKEGSDRPDEWGGLYVAPITMIRGCEVPTGQLCIFCTTNGDPTRIGFITDGDVVFVQDNGDGINEQLLEVLNRADWEDPQCGEGYSYLVRDALNAVGL
jgi:hypothetical protein